MINQRVIVSLTSKGLLGCGLGEGLDVGLQSLGAYIVGEAQHATFFPVSGMLGVAGELLGGPLMATTFAVRDEIGGPLGYCFLLSVVCFSYILRHNALTDYSSNPICMPPPK